MKFCTEKDVEYFFDTVADFESLLVRSGTRIAQILSRHQPRGAKERLADRHKDPLKAWKNSPVDAKALGKMGRLHQGAPTKMFPPHQSHARALARRARQP